MDEQSVHDRLQVIKNGTIDSNVHYEYISYTDTLGYELYPFQQQTIQVMNDLECDKVKFDDDILVSRVGVLANKVGSGKSLCMLGLIYNNPKLRNHPFVKYNFDDNIYVISGIETKIHAGNLIVAPHHLIKCVWIDHLKKSNLSYIVVQKNHFPIDWKAYDEYTVVLCSSRYYNMFIKNCTWCWSRVIFDEADAIHLPACVKPFTRFTWFITSSLHNLLFYQGSYWLKDDNGSITRYVTQKLSNHGYIKNTFKKITYSPFISKIVIKLHDEYILSSLHAPNVIYMTHMIDEPYYLKAVNNIVNDNVRSMLCGGDILSAMEEIGEFQYHDTKQNVISVLMRRNSEDIRKCNLKMKYLHELRHQFPSDTNVIRKYDKNNELLMQLHTYKSRLIQNIEDVYNDVVVDAKSCPICLEDILGMHVLFGCCLNIFCNECASKLTDKFNCPLCRSNVFKTHIINQSSNQCQPVTKSQMLIEVLKGKSEYRVLVYYIHNQSMIDLQTKLSDYKVNFKILNHKNIRNVLKWFASTKSGVLLADANKYSYGLDMNNVTHCVFYQKMPKDTCMQCVGRTLRIGRQLPLEVHSFYYDCETNT